LYVRAFSGIAPFYVVNEYPKSGGTWLSEMLAAALEIPYRRNRSPRFERSVIHGHFLRPAGIRNVIVMWRDGRDVMVSWYHHCLLYNKAGNKPLVDLVRRDLPMHDYEDVKGNLSKFIEYSFTAQKRPPFSWADFVDVWAGRAGVLHVKYEDLLENASLELIRIASELCGASIAMDKANAIANRFSFARVAGRQAGVEDKGQFLRKGIAGDWMNYFDEQSNRLFEHFAGRQLAVLGYADTPGAHGVAAGSLDLREESRDPNC
jgi:hypothetical protein